ncbi:TIGR01777 family oxidoreductase [Aridibaculum aurantiacum]|uniref:TIGR01777 family oxidoreductase n=1 Tax=Aridibaculum aurantiacum TaxID=2810307 RepID=UPI001A96430D|nr:TIGR01777 family oxidoreductase [Aridibaculum aurantiacum]
MSTILITGGSGLIGSALTQMLTKRGHTVIILSRSEKQSTDAKIKYAVWDVEQQTIDADAIAQADFIVHLAGASVAGKRWTEARKQEILTSRTESSKLILKALKEMPNKVQAVVSASAIGWYGDDKKLRKGVKAFTEDMPADDAYLGATCSAWEASIQPVEQLGKRLVLLRIGIVLSKEGGALPEFSKPVKMGIAGFLGGGKQAISWIHIDDLCRIFLHAIEKPEMKGVYNAVSPEPVTNKELTLEIANRMRGRFFVSMHVPAFVIKAMLGGMSIEVLKSTTVSSEKVLSTGFQFVYPSIDTALTHLLA